MSTLLEVKGLSAGYGSVPILHGIDFSLNEGEIVGVLGHNGMGKTTLLKAIMGIIPTAGGSIRYENHELTNMRANERIMHGIGYVPQGRGIFANLSVFDNIRMGIAALNDDEEDAIRRVMADFPRLERLLDRSGGALSGGEQQLLAIARCLISEPELILLDEPTEGIQPSIVEEIIELLQDLNRRRGVSIVLVEQNLDFITSLCDRILLIQKGLITGEVDSADATDAELAEQFTGFGGSSSALRKTPATTPTEVFDSKKTTGGREPKNTTMSVAPALAERHQMPPQQKHKIEKGNVYMTAQRPTHSQLKEIIEEFGMHMSDEKIQEFLDVMQGTLDAYDSVDAMPDYLPPVLYPRTAGYRPAPEENPLNAWYVKTEIRGAPKGPLLGKTVALKDNVCLAGVPMMNGASTLKGYTPDVDATIVSRLLDAGATIAGKAHCEYFCVSGGSHTGAAGPVHNPHKLGYSAGGSSSGSAALVGGEFVDLAIGGDQGGSIRIPSAYSGCYGMKPTHGLVPYTGIMPIEATIDHTGPISQNVRDNAQMLQVLAGEDWLDPRQYNPQVDDYLSAVGQGVNGVRIGILKEGFGHSSSEPGVDKKNRAAAELFRKLGATVDEVSIPAHLWGADLWVPIALEGLTNQMMNGNSMGTGWEGMYTTSLLDFHANWRSRADELSDTLKISMFTGQYYLKHHRGHYYAKSQNLARSLRAEYEKAFGKFDLLILPTVPMRATPLPPPDAPLSLICQRAFEMIVNTCPFNITGHPAMSIPCGMSDGLPVGLMIVGRKWQESMIYRAAAAFEQIEDWRRM